MIGTLATLGVVGSALVMCFGGVVAVMDQPWPWYGKLSAIAAIVCIASILAARFLDDEKQEPTP